MPPNKNTQTPRPEPPRYLPARTLRHTWEYAMLFSERPMTETELNVYGADGWELVSIFVRFDAVHAVFKREIQ